jgi:hypothetical protein
MSAHPTESDWEQRKAEIKHLYITESRRLKGPGGVMQEMSARYGFEAS